MRLRQAWELQRAKWKLPEGASRAVFKKSLELTDRDGRAKDWPLWLLTAATAMIVWRSKCGCSLPGLFLAGLVASDSAICQLHVRRR